MNTDTHAGIAIQALSSSRRGLQEGCRAVVRERGSGQRRLPHRGRDEARGAGVRFRRSRAPDSGPTLRNDREHSRVFTGRSRARTKTATAPSPARYILVYFSVESLVALKSLQGIESVTQVCGRVCGQVRPHFRRLENEREQRACPLGGSRFWLSTTSTTTAR